MEKYYRIEKNGSINHAMLDNDKLHLIEGDIFSDFCLSESSYKMEDVRILSPCQPSKIICLGRNYREHAKEMKAEPTTEPLLFMKPSTAVIGPGEEIIWPNDICFRLDYEAELAVVIGKKCKDVIKEEALDYIFGYTCANDVTARDLQPIDRQWTRAKSFDSFCPLGPAIVRGIDCNNCAISSRLNGVIRQCSNTSQLIFDVPYIISFVSRVMTLLPGDVICTGTPSGVGPMQDGDLIEVEIENIGILRNVVTLMHHNENGIRE